MNVRLLLRPLALALLVGLAVPRAHAQAAEDVTLDAPDGTSVVIDRDDYGVPHITAETEAAAFFAQGFAVAQDRLFQMETFWRTATGRLAEINPSAVSQDRQIRTVFYTPDERQELFDELPPELQTMLSSYVDGVNAYIDSTAANPDVYLPFEYTQPPLNGLGIEPWDIDKAMAVIQFFIRRFGEIGGEELVRLAELQANGEEWFNENRPINEPEAPVTLHTAPPGSSGAETVAYRGPEIDPALAEEVVRRRTELEASLDAHGVPRKFGSFAAVVGGALSESGNVMLLGAPQMGQPQQASKAVTSEVELLVGDAAEPELHVAGMTVPGIPGVIIGRNEGRTWTFTTGVTDNTDTYIETTDEAFQQYLYDGAYQPFEVITETINVLGDDPVEYTHFRTVHGPVYMTDMENQQAFTYKYAFWKRELEMAEALYGAWKAESVEGFQAAAEATPVSFNFFYADKDQNIAYWHVGDYPIRPGDTDPRLPLLGDGSEEWEGFMPFEEHPQAINPPQGYFVNWNNKPAAWWNQGDNVSWRMGAGRVYDGVTFLDAYLQESSPVSYEELQQLTCVVRSNPEYQEYPGTYQQAVEFSTDGSYAENVIPPGQSGFVNSSGVPSPNFADQWAFYQSSVACDEVEMKPFTFIGANVVANEPTATPGATPTLGALYPNPIAAASLTVRFELPESATARVDVVDLLGRTVAVLADGRQPAGPQSVQFDTAALPNGVYVVRLRAGDVTQSRKLTVLR
jgi:acyl-homoserine lactone acylase PvdQ